MTSRPTKKYSYSNWSDFDKRKIETHLSANDEFQCQQIYEKLEQLQPNGVCVNIETLRRALFPPIPISKNKNEQILLLKTSHRQCTFNSTKMPEIHLSIQSKSRQMFPISRLNFNQIINQVKKHSDINYSYYTRTK